MPSQNRRSGSSFLRSASPRGARPLILQFPCKCTFSRAARVFGRWQNIVCRTVERLPGEGQKKKETWDKQSAQSIEFLSVFCHRRSSTGVSKLFDWLATMGSKIRQRGRSRCFGDPPYRRKKYILGYVEMCFHVNLKRTKHYDKMSVFKPHCN